jgi:hypothetical protein
MNHQSIRTYFQQRLPSEIPANCLSKPEKTTL